jgi:aminoacyl tRNA synthase complex-interacting multifunctional protein 1
MSGIERLKQNSKLAQDLINEISAKIRSITPDADLENIKKTNEELRNEVAKWTEILTMVEIRKGAEPSFYLHYVADNGNAVETSGSGPAANSNKNVEAQPVKAAVQETKKKEAAPKKVEADENLNVPETGKGAAPEGGKGKQNKKQNKAPAAPAPAPVAEVIDVSRLDLRIGKIVEVDRHPEADSLYVEKIDVGEEKPRTIISGLVKHVPIEEMKDRLVVVLCNLKPAKMRGILSEGMVMCASSPDKVEILNPPPGVVPGDVIEFDGYTRNPDPVMNPKKKIFETVAPDLKTNDSKVATYKGVPFSVSGKGVVAASTLTNVVVK